ncbi:Ig-like domain-containing protein [Xenorhabdus sp. TH1]|uniref:Ig-like domain-containing protein n=1 Tax=Xenorhabdus sp. TH1 TaxID=3130166 RepID=UPI0030D18B01
MSISGSLTAPFLPQSNNGFIDESELSQPILVVVINQYEHAHVDDYITVHLNNEISSKRFYITEKNIHRPRYVISIPFSEIPLDSYDVFYTITDWTENSASSATTRVTIKKSDYPQPAVISYLETESLANGMPANGYTPNSVLITALDEKKMAVPGAPIHIVANDNTHITPSSGVTNQDGEVVFCVTSDVGGISSIQVASRDGNIKDKVELYFSPVNEAILIITGSEQIGEEYETITLQFFDKNTKEPIKNSIVYYKLDQAININNILEISLNPDTIRSVITDEIGQFQINLKGHSNGSCLIMVTANNYVGSINYTMGQQ